MTSVSIVINTLNRAADLARALDSFRWIGGMTPFEVIVVNGPSTDGTETVLEQWSGRIRRYRCAVANLSVSRNIGISAAAGDVVAFIDDDGIPEPEWLERLASAYDDEAVGAAGGFVYDHTGYNYQYRFGTADRLGNAVIDLDTPSEHLNFPFSFDFPHLLGTNSSFRRSALIEVGGFDEEFEYFLDETDVLARVIDAGYVVRQLRDAYVHHKFAPSHLRDTNRVMKNRYPILKNKVYYCIKHGRRYVGLDGALKAASDFFDAQRREVRWLVEQGMATESDAEALEEAIDRATERGIERGLALDPVMLSSSVPSVATPFSPFPTIGLRDRLCVVLVTGDYPPNRTGGIATFTSDLARALGATGHTVHVITRSPDINRVDFEGGVWVHRLLPRSQPRDPGLPSRVPASIWDWSATAREEARRISTHRKIDCVETPIWDCEGIAFLLEDTWPTVVSLQTTLRFWLDSHPVEANDQAFMRNHGTPLLELERFVLERAGAIRSISAAVREDIEARYEVDLLDDRVMVLPLGLERMGSFSDEAPPIASQGNAVHVLFVGRLEQRKGIDTLLDAVPLVLARCADVDFFIVGDDSLVWQDGVSYRHTFESTASDEVRRRVCFEGRVDDAALAAAYASCDLFVAPSRYESFGLVYLEAMRAGKPVIGCRVGGVGEVVDDGLSGILVGPGDPEALADAIVGLVLDPERRRAMGLHALERFESHFDVRVMAERSIDLYRLAMDVHGRPR